jgi:nucleotide-binding universal stress UspA family protein
MKLKRILVPTDLSKESLQAIGYAIDLGKPHGSEVVILYVLEPVNFLPAGEVMGPGPDLSLLMGEQRRWAKSELERLSQRLTRSGIKHRTLIGSGVASKEVTEAAAKLKADLIVMTTHGRTGVSHLLLGSVAEKVVRGAPCPVLTLRPVPGKKKRRT